MHKFDRVVKEAEEIFKPASKAETKDRRAYAVELDKEKFKKYLNNPDDPEFDATPMMDEDIFNTMRTTGIQFRVPTISDNLVQAVKMTAFKFMQDYELTKPQMHDMISAYMEKETEMVADGKAIEFIKEEPELINIILYMYNDVWFK